MSPDVPKSEATLCFAVDHPTAAGHFPGHPILPGAVLLDEIVAAIEAELADGARACEVRAAKFLKPVRPGDSLALRWHCTAPGAIAFEVVGPDGTLALSGSLAVESVAG